jgi:gas vesicle protein
LNLKERHGETRKFSSEARKALKTTTRAFKQLRQQKSSIILVTSDPDKSKTTTSSKAISNKAAAQHTA